VILTTGPGGSGTAPRGFHRDERCPPRRDRGAKRFGIAVVHDDLIGTISFTGKGGLGMLAKFEILGRPAPFSVDSSEALVVRRVDEENGVAKVVPSRLKKDRRIEHDAGLAISRRPRNGTFERLPHRRMKDRFKIAACVGIGEDDPGQCLAIDLRLRGFSAFDCRREDDRAEPFDNEVARRSLREQGMTNRVGVEPMEPQVGEHDGSQALARSNPADETNHGYRSVRPGTSWLEGPVHPVMARFVT